MANADEAFKREFKRTLLRLLREQPAWSPDERRLDSATFTTWNTSLRRAIDGARDKGIRVEINTHRTFTAYRDKAANSQAFTRDLQFTTAEIQAEVDALGGTPATAPLPTPQTQPSGWRLPIAVALIAAVGSIVAAGVKKCAEDPPKPVPVPAPAPAPAPVTTAAPSPPPAQAPTTIPAPPAPTTLPVTTPAPPPPSLIRQLVRIDIDIGSKGQSARYTFPDKTVEVYTLPRTFGKEVISVRWHPNREMPPNGLDGYFGYLNATKVDPNRVEISGALYANTPPLSGYLEIEYLE